MLRFCYRGHCDWLEWLPAPPSFLKYLIHQLKKNLAVEARWLYIMP